MVDNSIISPVLSQPLEFGGDIVMHSATKFIAGHSDVMAGAVKGKSLANDIAFLQNAEGSGLAPFDVWLCLRGIKTMALRAQKQQENAQKIAEFLPNHPELRKLTMHDYLITVATPYIILRQRVQGLYLDFSRDQLLSLSTLLKLQSISA